MRNSVRMNSVVNMMRQMCTMCFVMCRKRFNRAAVPLS